MNSKPKIYRVVIFEPSPVVRSGIGKMLEESIDFELAGSFADLERLTERLSPMDTEIIIVNPLILEFTRRSAVRLIFQNFPGVALVGLLYGAVDMEILKQFNGVIDIYDDRQRLASKLKSAMDNVAETPLQNDGYDLSEREKEILVAVVRGLMNKEIAELHHISIHTVISHRKNITRKTGIKSISGLTVYALLNNLIEQSDIQL